MAALYLFDRSNCFSFLVDCLVDLSEGTCRYGLPIDVVAVHQLLSLHLNHVLDPEGELGYLMR